MLLPEASLPRSAHTFPWRRTLPANRLSTALEGIDESGGIRGNGGYAAELPAIRHGIRLLAKADLHAILHQSPFVWIPANFSGEAKTSCEDEKSGSGHERDFTVECRTIVETELGHLKL